MEIVNLCDKQQFIPRIADWIYAEFIHNLRHGISLDDVTASLRKRRRNELPLTYVGVVDGECVGTASLVQNDLKARGDLTPWLAALYVREDHRGQGYAPQLINKVTETAVALGFSRLYLRTETAANYYRRLGWKKIYETVDEFELFTEVFEKVLDLE